MCEWISSYNSTCIAQMSNSAEEHSSSRNATGPTMTEGLMSFIGLEQTTSTKIHSVKKVLFVSLIYICYHYFLQ
jgi:hypothetical protein